MDALHALDFVRQHGVVLASGKGPVPRLAEVVAGEPVHGSWWGHSRGREIFRVFQSLRQSNDILVCRLIGGKITFVHRRLWPALVRAADNFTDKQLAQVHEEHTSAGRHVTHEVPYPTWVPAEVHAEAARLSEAEALKALGPWAGACVRLF